MLGRDSDGGRSVRMELSRARRLIRIAFVMMVAVPVQASDGALEINQTCAVETGCFAGDAAGYPVTISAPGSYRLTSNLAIATDVNGVEISSSNVTLDLGGFEVAGPGACTGTGATLSCGSVGSGVGIVGFEVLSAVTIRNGVVRNMRLDGVGVGGTGSLGVRIEGITARHNARLGISGQDGVLARNCMAIENGGNGFDLDAGSIVESSVAIGNFGHGVEIDDVGGVISGTTSRANAGRGINVTGAGSKVTGNTVVGNSNEGIFATLGAVITHNAIRMNGLNGITTGAAVVTDNTTTENNGYGIECTGPCRIERNVVSANQGSGIGGLIGRGTIASNVVSDNGGDGISASGGTSVDRNNVQANAGYGIRFPPSQGTGFDGVYRGNTIRVTGSGSGAVLNGLNLGDNYCGGPISSGLCP